MTKNHKKFQFNRKNIIIISDIILLSFTIILAFYVKLLPPKITSIIVGDINDDYTVTMTVNITNYTNKKDIWCFLSTKNKVPLLEDFNWMKSTDGTCKYNIDAGNYIIYLKDRNGSIISSDNKTVKIDKIISINIDDNDLYLPINSTYQLNTSVIMLGKVESKIKYISSNQEIASVDEKGIITLHKDGETIITAYIDDEIKDEINVISTSLVRKASLNSKSKLKCEQYTLEEAHLLDEILSSRVNEGGYASRGGVIAAARFLTMEFPYKVPYFFENGRLNNYGNKRKVDGEGRYYHKGLYLSKDKYDDISSSLSGPGMWGCRITSYQNEAGYVSGHKYPNGLDCSGFVSWVLLNGGFDPGDTGAGANSFRDDDLDDLGEKVYLDEALMTSGRVKVGDLIARDGHMAVIAGLDGKNVYIAESLYEGVTIKVFSIYEPSKLYHLYGYVNLMDEYYKREGKYTNMW